MAVQVLAAQVLSAMAVMAVVLNCLGCYCVGCYWVGCFDGVVEMPLLLWHVTAAAENGKMVLLGAFSCFPCKKRGNPLSKEGNDQYIKYY